MSESEPLSQYERIAMDIAGRIADGDIPEGTRLFGRSTLASEYHVSPETARKAVVLLADMKVVEVHEKSGSTVISAENARQFLKEFHNRGSYKQLRQELHRLILENMEVGKRMTDICTRLIDANRTMAAREAAIPCYEAIVPEASDKIGKNLGSLRFWQATGATVMAIRRNDQLMISPGPYAELYAGDVIVFAGNTPSIENVRRFLNQT